MKWLILLLSFPVYADLTMPIEEGKVVVTNSVCPIKYDDGFERSAYIVHQGKLEKACWQAIGNEYYIRMYEWQPIGIIHFGNFNFYQVK